MVANRCVNSQCFHSLITGMRARSRDVLVHGQHGGRRCPEPLTQNKYCAYIECFQWQMSDWGPCQTEVSYHFYRASICEGGLESRNSVRPSVRPSVCLSVTRVHCDKTKWRTADIFIHMKGQSICYSDTKEWLVGDAPFILKSALKVTHPLRKTPTSTDFRL